MRRLPVDLWAAAAAAVSVAMLLVYLQVVSDQGTGPASWVVVVLVVAALGAAYRTVGGPYSGRVAVGAGVLLLLLGLAAILTIGLPLLLAGALCLLSAVRRHPEPVGP